MKQRRETTLYQEKIRGERRRKYLKSGGFIGTLSSIKLAQPRPIRITRKRKKTKKGKRKTRKRSQPRAPAYKMPDINDFRLKF